jgi:hypothetical protein
VDGSGANIGTTAGWRGLAQRQEWDRTSRHHLGAKKSGNGVCSLGWTGARNHSLT